MNHLIYRCLLHCVAFASVAILVSPCLLAQGSYSSPPIVNILQVEPQGPTLYPALYRGVVQGNILYITEQDNVSGNSNLVLINISTAAAPTIISQTAGSGPGMNGIAVNGRYVYVSYYQSSVVQVFDASNPYSLTSVGSVTTACNNAAYKGLYGALAIAGNYLYAPCPNANGTGFIDVLSIANPTSPTELGVITAQNSTNPPSLAVGGQMLYASEPNDSGPSAVCAYNLASGPMPTVPLSCATVDHSPQNIEVEGTTVAAAIGDYNELDIIDFSNAANPHVYSVALDPNLCVHPFVENMVAFQGNTVFVGCSNSSHPPGPGYGVEAINATNITAPTLLGTMFGSAGNSFSMIVPNGEYLYLGGFPEQNGNPSSTAGALYTVETGTGTNQDNVTFLPASVSFANQALGTNSAAQSVTISNSGTAALTNYGITIAGANPGDFSQTNTCGSLVAAGGSCTINVTFTPTAAGTRNASLFVSDDASGSPQTLPLSGTGTTVAASSGVLFNAIGSSALYLEMGQAAAQELQTQISGTNYQCLWTGGSGALVATDPTTGQPENGSSWIAWNIDTVDGGKSCANPGTSPKIYSYLQTDSVVGVRCLFNGCNIRNNASGGTTQNAIFPTPCTPDGSTPNEEVCNLPASIAAFWGSGFGVNVAGTDIRPEDALFATKRTHFGCGERFSGQYLGMGYPYATSTSPSLIKSYYTNTGFNVANFSIQSGAYHVFSVGMAPVLVTVNQTDGSTNGFANQNIQNIASGVLAEILDGSFSETQDILGKADSTNMPITVLEREPLSGTYNTMEYNVSNSLENKTSQDVGYNQQSSQQNCNGIVPLSNPMSITTADGSGVRNRVIGTGEMLNVLFGTGRENSYPIGAVLGYAFWSVGNYKGAYSGIANYKNYARYLTVDGVDPLFASYTPFASTASSGECNGTICPSGTIPTAANGGLQYINFQNVRNGSYPIWSFLRLVCVGSTSSTGCTAASGLSSELQNFVSFGTATSNTDFVPVTSSTFPAYNSLVVRSHFLISGIGDACSPVSNGVINAIVAESGECGGDVGGVVYTQAGDADFANDLQTVYVGQTGNRR